MKRVDPEEQIRVLQQSKKALEQQIQNLGRTEETTKHLDELQKKLDALTGKSPESKGN